MKIQINEDESELEITDEDFNVDNYLRLTLKQRTQIGSGEETTSAIASMDVTAEELFAAAKAFYEMRTRRRQADKLL